MCPPGRLCCEGVYGAVDCDPRDCREVHGTRRAGLGVPDGQQVRVAGLKRCGCLPARFAGGIGFDVEFQLGGLHAHDPSAAVFFGEDNGCEAASSGQDQVALFAVFGLNLCRRFSLLAGLGGIVRMGQLP